MPFETTSDEHINDLPVPAPAVDDLVPAETVPDSVAGLMPGALDDAFDPWSHHDGADPDPEGIARSHEQTGEEQTEH
jgi:hypothetical protein